MIPHCLTSTATSTHPSRCHLGQRKIRYFLHRAQYAKRRCITHVRSYGGTQNITFETNDLACCSCGKVKAARHFALQQRKVKNAKESRHSGEENQGDLFCISCCVAKNTSRTGTCLRLAGEEKLEPAIKDERLKHIVESTAYGSCVDCIRFQILAFKPPFDLLVGCSEEGPLRLAPKTKDLRTGALYTVLRMSTLHAGDPKFCDGEISILQECKSDCCRMCGFPNSSGIANCNQEWWCGRGCPYRVLLLLEELMKDRQPFIVPFQTSSCPRSADAPVTAEP